MNKQREALELALAALCYDNSLSRGATIVAIREALAEPEQEPVAYVDKNYGIMRINDGIDLPIGAKLYTAPPARKPLTDEQLRTLARDAGIKLMNDEALALGYLPAAIKKFARAIERAHGIGVKHE